MRASSSRRVSFASSTRQGRPARDDELSVMEHFSRHASRCRRCNDPCKILTSGDTLCERGRAYARDVVQYVFWKEGKPFSVLDNKIDGEKVQIEIPAQLNVIRDLLKATEKGLMIGKEEILPQKKVYCVRERTQRGKPDKYEIVEVQYEVSRRDQNCEDPRRKAPHTGSRTNCVRDSKQTNDTSTYRDEKTLTVYALLIPTVVKLELRGKRKLDTSSTSFEVCPTACGAPRGPSSPLTFWSCFAS